MPGNGQPLDNRVAVVNPDGTPTLYFMKWAQDRQIDIKDGISAQQCLDIINQFMQDHQITAGTGIQITPSGNIADGITIAADIQAALDSISSTRGSVLYRGATGWAGLGPGTVGQVLQSGGAGADPSWVTGGGGGGGVFGPTNAVTYGGTLTHNAACMGMFFQPKVTISIKSCLCVLNAASLAETFKFALFNVASWTTSNAGGIYIANAPASQVLGTEIARTNNFNALVTGAEWFIPDFSATPLVAPAGGTYYFACIRTDGTGTSTTRLGWTAQDIHSWGFQGKVFNRLVGYNSITPAGTSAFVVDYGTALGTILLPMGTT